MRYPPSPRLLTCLLAALALLALPAAAPAATLKPAAKKFLAQHEAVNARFKPKEAQVLAMIAAKRKELKACPTVSALPDDSYQQIISELYVLLDMIQEAAAFAHDDLVCGANSYRGASYSRPGAQEGRSRARPAPPDAERAEALRQLLDHEGLGGRRLADGLEADRRDVGGREGDLPPRPADPRLRPLKRRLRKLGASRAQLRADRLRRGHRARARRLGPDRPRAVSARAPHRLALTCPRAGAEWDARPCHPERAPRSRPTRTVKR